jgi:hypothetical protein
MVAAFLGVAATRAIVAARTSRATGNPFILVSHRTADDLI